MSARERRVPLFSHPLEAEATLVAARRSLPSALAMIDQRRRFDRLMISTRHLARLTECFGETVRDTAHGPSATVLFGSMSADKEAIARGMHSAELRRSPFIHVSCRYVPADMESFADVTQQLPGPFLASRFSTVGLLRSADAGTLYLENVDLLPALAREEMFLALADQSIYSAPQNRMISIEVNAIASIDTMFADEDFEYCVATHIPLNVLAEYLDFFETYWAADEKTLAALAESLPKRVNSLLKSANLDLDRESLPRRIRDWMDGLLHGWSSRRLDY